MLQPDRDRLDFGALLAPPPGFQLDKAIAATYSLDLDTLISIPIALCFSSSLELSVKDHMVEILEAIRRTSEFIRIYCQKGQIKVPANQHRLYSFIEECVVQMPPAEHRSFHPKVWMLRFKNGNDLRYRVIVMSRNLTFDRSWDVVFQVEGEVQQGRSNRFGQNRPIVDFARWLVQTEAQDWSSKFISDLGKTKFVLQGGGMESFEFMPMGIPRYTNRGFLHDRYDQFAVVSPFLGKTGLDYIIGHSRSKPVLFSRLYELRKLKDKVKEKLEIYHLDQAFVEAEEHFETETAENSDQQHQDLHAKIYCGKLGRDASLYLGSANCSSRAMNSNIEFMVRIQGRDSKIGPKVLCDELLKTNKYFVEYDPGNDLSAEEEQQCAREQQQQDLKIKLANVIVSASADREEEGIYAVAITINLEQVVTDAGIKGDAWLLNAENQGHALAFGQVNQWNVKHIAELDLSSFLIIRLHEPEFDIQTEFALKIKISGLPATRGSRIFTNIIANSALFFRYLRFLLAENFWEEQGDKQNEMMNHFGAGEGLFNFREEPIYENMLKAISREPEKLKEIKQVMEKISAEEDAEVPIIPEDFKQLWQTFENTLLRIK